MPRELGKAKCVLCGADGAKLMEGEKGRAYLNCGECVSMVRSMSGAGDRLLRKLLIAAPAKPAADKPTEKKSPEKKVVPPVPPPAEPKKTGGAGFF